MRILFAYRQRSAVCYYRSILPARALQALGHEVGLVDYLRGLRTPDPVRWVQEFAGKYDLIVTDRAYDDYRHLGFLAGLRNVNPGSRMIVDFDDDFTNVPIWNDSFSSYQPGQAARKVGEAHLKLAEMATVPTQRLAEVFEKKTHSIRVAPNCIDPRDWDGFPVNPERSSDPKLRILYGGAGGHYGDLDEVRPGLEAILKRESLPIRLICLGSAPFWMHEAARGNPSRMLILPWVDDFFWYPKVVAWGGFDVSIAPLADHPFNHAKSQIKALEAAVQGVSFVCSDVGPYSKIPDDAVFKVSNTPVQWAETLGLVLESREVAKKKAIQARNWALENYSMARLGEVWQTIVDEVMSLPRIDSLEATRLPSDPRPVPPEDPAPRDGEAATSV